MEFQNKSYEILKNVLFFWNLIVEKPTGGLVLLLVVKSVQLLPAASYRARAGIGCVGHQGSRRKETNTKDCSECYRHTVGFILSPYPVEYLSLLGNEWRSPGR